MSGSVEVFHDIHHRPRLQKRFETLRSFHQKIRDYPLIIDFRSIIYALKKLGISGDLTPESAEGSENRISVTETLLKIGHKVGYLQLACILLHCGHFEIASYLMSDLVDTQIREIRKSISRNGSSDFILKYYFHTKLYIDNNIYADRETSLRIMINRFKHKLLTEPSQGKRQDHLDRLVVLFTSLVTQCKTIERRRETLQEMKDCFPKNSELDTTMLDIAFLSKMAVTEVLAGNDNEEEVEHLIQGAQVLSENYLSDFCSTALFHDKVYIAWCRYQRTGRETDFRRLRDLFEKENQRLRNENAEIQNQWLRIVMLFVAMANFGIGIDLSMFECAMYPGHLDTGIRMLNTIRNVSDNIETRRSMILELCESKAEDAKGNTPQAIAHIEKAQELAENGGTFFDYEKTNISRYHGRLLLGRDKQKLTASMSGGVRRQ